MGYGLKAYIYGNASNVDAAQDWQQALFIGGPFVDSTGAETNRTTFQGGWYGFEGFTVNAGERTAIEAAPAWIKRVVTNDAGLVLSANVTISGTVNLAAIRLAVGVSL